ncbi:helix-turn-helix transcriptional regulator [Prosthecomicrobium sp. N25]|uniref:helix-turn-helix transcriptional regulator n=1 Tax=Prosthecomicrobium sp. N25 TaxID=3129254 RepID=UPI003077DD99
MQSELFTTAEAADYLRLKERKLYELVSEGAIPCTKVTGKWLFPKADLDRWLARGLVRPAGVARPEPPPILGGSHDPLIEWALRESGSGLASLPEGSERGLVRFEAGEVAAAAIHLHALGDVEDANVATVASKPGYIDAVMIGLVRREQGLLVAEGNPLRIADLPGAIQAGATFALRPAGAGAQLLLLKLLAAAGSRFDDLRRLQPLCPTGPDLAQAIRSGRADVGIATRSVAVAAGLGFVPLIWEDFDLVLRQRQYFTPPFQALAAFLASGRFRERAAEMTGYDTSMTGRVRWLG